MKKKIIIFALLVIFCFVFANESNAIVVVAPGPPEDKTAELYIKKINGYITPADFQRADKKIYEKMRERFGAHIVCNAENQWRLTDIGFMRSYIIRSIEKPDWLGRTAVVRCVRILLSWDGAILFCAERDYKGQSSFFEKTQWQRLGYWYLE